MEKKLYYIIDNGDSSYTMELDGCVELIKGESEDIKKEGDEKDVQWIMEPIWLTDEEFDNLPEAE
jgi:hypothetical protein